MSGDTPVGPPRPLPSDDEDLLALTRRIDWRFLLPSPELGNVIYLGHDDSALVGALARFAGRVVVHGSEGSNADEATFDLAVLSRPTRDECVSARRLLGPAGLLYAELDRPLNKARRPGALRSAARAGRVLRGLGFTQLAAYWHWPNFAATSLVIPLDRGEAIAYALERRWVRAADLRMAAGRAVAATGLLSRLAPHASIVAVAPR